MIRSPRDTTVMRRSLSVSSASGVMCPPMRRATIGASVLEHARVRFGDDLKAFHDCGRYVTLAPITAQGRPDCRPLHLLSRPTFSARVQPSARHADEIIDATIRRRRHLVCVLKGAFMFLADLARALDVRRVTLDFIAVSSYGPAPRRPDRCSCSRISTPPIEGRDVVIVEDIVDTGLTLTYLQDILQRAGAAHAAHGLPAEQAVAPRASTCAWTTSASRSTTCSWSATAWTHRDRYRNLPYIAVVGT